MPWPKVPLVLPAYKREYEIARVWWKIVHTQESGKRAIPEKMLEND